MTFKRYRTFLLLFLCLIFASSPMFLTSVRAAEVDVEESELNAFHIEIKLDTDNHKLLVKQRLDYKNNTGVDLSEIYFNVYPPAFREVGGDTEFTSVKAAGAPVSLRKVETTVYSMPLPSALESGEKLSIEMEYVVSIPEIENRFGHEDKVYNLGNVIVMPAVYEESGWASNPYVDLGDAFYSDLADFTVSIKVPEGFSVAASGALNEDGEYVAHRIRDFSFCVSNRFETKTASVGDVEITVFYIDDMDETATRVLETSERALLLFNDRFSVYPYKKTVGRVKRYVERRIRHGVSHLDHGGARHDGRRDESRRLSAR
ncbi:MAG TPA: M1 family metallopeptidase [Fastidiosipila sp.]|nr:M1 family metallopeptidase [Fastidiosipila sp.]